ncbi:MAG: BREX-1 system adenine-specific DNA-methyltransferase PglX [Pseudomonas sp.]|nr:BREX-1 system adenine-specific DNA-methyltransferase PglX [Pseudomonas sp.]
MNTANLKRYAPKARIDFIAAMQKQAAHLGITAKHIEPLEVKGDIALIGGRTFPAQIKTARERLVTSIEQHGFAHIIEQAAYSWFNRLCAIRFMEVHGYFDHGRRVLSSTHAGSHVPQLLEECLDINLDSDLPSLDKQRIIELKLDGTQDEQLYRELLLAQCHALHQVMPFLFEAVDGALELLLPDNLTKTDSLIRELVSAIPEEDWQDVEIIGWLYQFYISDKKDQVIGKVVKSEDIPAATQLFTPNWIVQYLVQNSLGRQWLQTYPDSPLKAQMQYYIDAGEQPPAVIEKLAEITPKQLDPESIKVLDPACGSGHILVEAYKVLKAIYEERGHRSRDIPLLILTNNLFGLDIDDRAAQLASFTVLMLARADDRRIFSRLAENHVRLNILALQETNHLNLDTLWQALNLNKDWNTGASMGLFADTQQDLSSAQADQRYMLLQDCLQRFAQAKTFGSLIDVPAEQYQTLHELYQTLQQLAQNGDVMQKPAAEQLLPYVQQAWMLAQRYDAVVANPPYMGSKYQTAAVKKYLKDNFKDYDKDLFSAFIVRNLQLSKPHGQLGFMTPFVWMFISSYEKLREFLIKENTITSLIQLEYSGFDGATVPICTFTLENTANPEFAGGYVRLSDFKGAAQQGPRALEIIQAANKQGK